MFLAAVHLNPALTITVAVALSAIMVWYWHEVGRDEVPSSRRRIRRVSLAFMLISLPMFVRAASFVDPVLDRRAYAIAWTAATLMLLLIILSAVVDALNNLRLHQQQRQDELREAAVDLARSIHARNPSGLKRTGEHSRRPARESSTPHDP